MSMSGPPLPTPECIDVSSVTPDSVKSPTPPAQVNASAADGGGGTAEAESTNAANDTATEDRSGSPPPSCPICLGTYKNKCFTDSCLHQFCFNCLLEWSKIKAECPLCKQSFKSIIHNVKSEREFEEYLVQQPLHYNLMLSEPFRFSYSTTLQVRPSQNEALQRLFLHHPSLTDRYVYPRNETPNVRRRIYERGLYALPLFDITGRARECSAEYYRLNQAQTHRLIPFLNREAIHVIQDPRRVSSLLQRAMDILITHDITSVEFRRVMEPYFREHTVHFVHEFYNFARSPYDLYGYDNNVQYSQDYNLAMHVTESGNSEQQGVRTRSGGVAGSSRSGNSGGGSSGSRAGGASSSSNSLWPSTHDSNTIVDVLSSSSSLSGSDDESPVIRPAVHAAGTTGIVRREPVSVIQSNPGTASTSSGTTAAATTTTQIKTEQHRVESVIRTAGEPSVKIELSDTDSDECQFVLERKPPHLRTPEYVSLNSDEDSDVVFVNQSTSGPVLPTKVASHSHHPQQQPHCGNLQMTSSRCSATNMSLMEDSSHMPMFMPYMYGMDTSEPGPSGTSTGIVTTAAPVETKPTPPTGAELKFKYEDPMLAAPSASGAQRRKRKSQRRNQQLAHEAVWSSSDDDSEEENDEETGGPTSSRRRRIVAQPRNYANTSSPESESSHDEYRVTTMAKKREALPRTPRKKKKRRSTQRRLSKKERMRRKRQKRSDSPVPGPSHVEGQEEPPHLNSTDSSCSRSGNEGEGINGRAETVTHQLERGEGNLSEDIQVDGDTQSDGDQQQSQKSSTEEENEGDNASNQGSVATSVTQPSTSVASSESEDLDVQNDDSFDD